MKSGIIIVKNITREGPGLLEGVLNEGSIPYHMVDLHQNESLPSLLEYKAVVVLGGPDSANDDNHKIKNELLRIREALDANIPYLGICLGLQMLVKAAGGKVTTSPTKEVGLIGPDAAPFSVKLTEAGKEDPLLRGLDDTFEVFQLHGETVELTKDMLLLASGTFCRNQIVKVGQNAYGIQCHVELTPEMLESWMAEDPDLQKLNADELRARFELIHDEYTQTAKKLFRNFLHLAGL